jgi:tetratricopeptide (TPR) repeat protein
MSDDTPIVKTLKEILHNQSYEQLGLFTDQEVWPTLNDDERILLARLFTMAAESDLSRSSSPESIQSAKKSFDHAAQLAPEDANIWYRRGLSLASLEPPTLLEECTVCLEKASLLDPTRFEIWHLMANVFVRRGMVSKDPAFFTQAEEIFKKAESLRIEPQKNPQFYWHFGIAYFMMGRHSGEAGDTHKAISCYRKAKEEGLRLEVFYNDFANALVELSLLINSNELMFEAIELYLYSLDNAENAADSPRDIAVRYCNLGACYQYLFEIHHEETYFKQAEECYIQSTKILPNFSNAVAFWGYLLLYAAKLWQDVSYLEECIEKLSNLTDYADDKPLVLARMSEAFSLYGANEEELKFLTNAQELAESATIEGSDCPFAWASLALANLELGRYFADPGYFRVAVDAAEKAISLNDKIGMSWHVLAVAKFALGEYENNLQLMQEASVGFSIASKTDVGRFGYMWNDWGISLLCLGDITREKKYIQESIEKFEQAILLHEHVNPVWLVNYGSSLDFWGEIADDEECYEKSVEVLEHALTLDPENIHAKYHLGLALCHLGELTGELTHLHRGIEVLQGLLQEDREDDSAWADLAMAYMHVAEQTQDAELKRSLLHIAEQNFMQAVSLGNQHVFYSIACLHSLLENAPAAYQFLQKAHENDSLPPLNDIMEDRWLDFMRSLPDFTQFLRKLK